MKSALAMSMHMPPPSAPPMRTRKRGRTPMARIRESVADLFDREASEGERASDERETFRQSLDPLPKIRVEGQGLQFGTGELSVQMTAPTDLTWRPKEVWAILPDGQRVRIQFATPARAERRLPSGEHVRLYLTVPPGLERPRQLILEWPNGVSVEVIL